jgi:hypothetical protein
MLQEDLSFSFNLSNNLLMVPDKLGIFFMAPIVMICLRTMIFYLMISYDMGLRFGWLNLLQ